MGLLSAAAALAFAGCAGTSVGDVPHVAGPAASTAPPRRVVPPVWSEDAVEIATASAREADALLLVDAWAPWCHTCLSMKREVLSSPALGAYGDRVVFAAIDTDKPSSAAFMARYAIEVWPTFFVIDPRADRVLAVHGGAASLDELRGVLDGALALRKTGGGGAFETALRDGAAAYAARRFAAASEAYQRAAAIEHPRASEAYLGAVRASFEGEDFATCANIGARRLDAVAGSAMAADFTFYARECAKKLPPGPARAALLDRTRSRLRAIASDPPRTASIDDRADALAMLGEAETEGGDAAAAKAATDARVALLDAAAASAGTPAEAAVYDYMRMRAYEDAGKPELAIAMLEQRTRETPDNYEPFARLASVLAKTDPKRSLEVWPRAVALSYGPRRVRYLEQLADVQAKLGDMPGVLAARRAVVAALEALPPGQADPARLEKAKQALAAAGKEREERPGPADKSSLPRPTSRAALPPAR